MSRGQHKPLLVTKPKTPNAIQDKPHQGENGSGSKRPRSASTDGPGDNNYAAEAQRSPKRSWPSSPPPLSLGSSGPSSDPSPETQLSLPLPVKTMSGIGESLHSERQRPDLDGTWKEME
ncbi:hypothetical protein SLS55_010270 [Diplodia seriata]|uniref:Uncharacterized protein n=1 Tax=Diplodia seriata TaxID=420778 RepID=A0ABR3BY22_9PEZI